jgi:tetratricopeptide (TPR) repeat protein
MGAQHRFEVDLGREQPTNEPSGMEPANALRTLPQLVETLGLLRVLVKDSPSHRGDLARALNNLGYLRLVMGQKDQARALLEESLELVRPLAASNPLYQGDLQRTMANLEQLKRQGR